jgi:hypothetical protein
MIRGRIECCRHGWRRPLRWRLRGQISESIIAIRIAPRSARGLRLREPAQRVIGIDDCFPSDGVRGLRDPPVVLGSGERVGHVHDGLPASICGGNPGQLEQTVVRPGLRKSVESGIRNPSHLFGDAVGCGDKGRPSRSGLHAVQVAHLIVSIVIGGAAPGPAFSG